MTIAASCYQASCELLTLQAGVSQDGMLLSRLGSDLLKCHCHSSCASLVHKQSFSSCEVSEAISAGRWIPEVVAELFSGCLRANTWRVLGAVWLGVHVSVHVCEDASQKSIKEDDFCWLQN